MSERSELRPHSHRPADFLEPGHGVRIPADEVELSFTASGGPGGQHANRSNTKVLARLDLTAASGIPDELRARLVTRLGPQVAVMCDTFRSQTRNRQEALERITQRLAAALVVAAERRRTRPTRGSVVRRLDAKRSRSDTKRLRRPPSDA